MPKTKREEVAAMVSLLALLEGVYFDTSDFRKFPYEATLVTRVLKSLVDSNLLVRIRDRRSYMLTDKLKNTLKREVLRKTPRSGIYQFPSLDIFNVSGIEAWDEHQFETYVSRMDEMRRRLCQDSQAAMSKAAIG